MMHDEDSRALFQVNFGIFHRRIFRQVIAGMSIAQKVRVESDYQGVGRGTEFGKRRLDALQFGLEVPNRLIGAIEGG